MREDKLQCGGLDQVLSFFFVRGALLLFLLLVVLGSALTVVINAREGTRYKVLHSFNY